MDTLNSEQICGLDDRLVCVFAPIAAGKTQLLVEKVAALAAAGADLTRVLVAVNTAEQARALRTALHEALRDTPRGTSAAEQSGSAPHIEVPLKALLDELAAQGPTQGPAPRLLTRSEFNIALEDLKFAGHEPRAIRAMLDALLGDLAQGADPCQNDGLSEDARAAYQGLRSILGAWGATMREEVPALVLRAQAAEKREQPRTRPFDARPFDYVLIDDAQNLSPATLAALAGLAARQTLAVGNPLQAIPGFDAGFSPHAFEEFAVQRAATVVELEPLPTPAAAPATAPAAASLAQALCAFGHEGETFCRPPVDVSERGREALLHIKWREPADEVAGVCRIVANLLAADPDLLPRDVAIAVPNRMWAREFEAELARRRIPFQTLLDDDPIAGDPRSRERLGTLEVYATLALAANIDDLAAWRLWLALGRRDLGCPLWSALLSHCAASGLSVRQAIEALAASHNEPFAGAAAVRARATEAFAALKAVEGKRGFTLRNHLCQTSRAPRLATTFEFFSGTEDAPGLFAALQAFSFMPSFADRPSQVCLGSYRAVSTCAPKHVLVPGLVEGIMPPVAPGASDQASLRLRNLWRRALGCAVGGARESLTLCSFQRADIALAQAYDLPVRRTRRFQGREVALFVRSSFIEDAGEAAPGSLSGEQYFIDE